MPRPCTGCTHPERAALDRALVGGDPNRAIARRFGLSKDAVARHRADHLPEKLAQAEGAAQAAEATDLLREVRALRSKAYGLLLKAESGGTTGRLWPGCGKRGRAWNCWRNWKANSTAGRSSIC